MRTLPLLALLLASAPAGAGQPVLVPDFTPGTTSEFAVAFMLQERVLAALGEAGHLVLGNEAVAPVVGIQVEACADVDACPFVPLQSLPVRLAVVVRVVRADGQLQGELELYERSVPSALHSRVIQVVPGREYLFAGEVVAAVNELFAEIGPGPAQHLVEASQLVARAQAEAEARATAPSPADPPPPTRVVIPTQPTDDLSVLLQDSEVEPRHLLGARNSFLRAMDEGMTPDEWMHHATPHGGRVTVEVHAGLGMGDVHRAADIRLDLDDELQTRSEWIQEGPQPGRRVRGGVYVGYAPIAWLDVGALLGLQYSQKSLTIGWLIGGEEGGPDPEPPVQAVQLYLQPRLRLYAVPVGPVKPYGLGGVELRVFDNYEIVSPPSLRYPEPPGGVFGAGVVGGGLLVDPGPIVGFFAEGTYAHHFGVRAGPAQQGHRPARPPAPPTGTGHTVAVVGGVQFRL